MLITHVLRVGFSFKFFYELMKECLKKFMEGRRVIEMGMYGVPGVNEPSVFSGCMPRHRVSDKKYMVDLEGHSVERKSRVAAT